MRTERGLLVVPIWMGRWSQFIPGQAAIGKDKLNMVVPQVPAGCQAWEVSPGDVRSLKTERVIGGTKVTLPEFGLTTAVVFTSDNGPTGLLVRFQDQTRRLRRIAAQWAHDLAEVELEKVMKVQAQLERMGRVATDAKALENDARSRLRTCVDHYNNGDFREAYLEAQRAVRPLRILMRVEWEEAIRGLDSPVASPYAVSFYTLPRQWDFIQQVRQAMPGANVLPNGDFELTPDRTPESWTAQEITLDDVSLEARRVTDDPKEGRQCLKLEIKPKTTTLPDGKPIPPPAALERTFLAINSPAVKLDAGSWVRISGWIKIPKPITASADGVLFYDSAGGEPLAVRLTNVPRWQRFTLYRQVPASGQMSVTLALTGIGTAYFDDIRIEPLLPPATAAAHAAALRN